MPCLHLGVRNIDLANVISVAMYIFEHYYCLHANSLPSAIGRFLGRRDPSWGRTLKLILEGDGVSTVEDTFVKHTHAPIRLCLGW